MQYSVFGKYASEGMASALNASKPDCTLETVTASDHALLKILQNVDGDTTAPGNEVISSSQAFLYAVLNGPKTVWSQG